MSDRPAREVWVHKGTTWVRESELEALEAKLEALEHTERYYVELICAVATKNEDETRHQTALRYIRERETHRSGPPAAAAERSE